MSNNYILQPEDCALPYSHYANGITFKSQILFPELASTTKEADFLIRKGKVPRTIKNITYTEPNFKLNDRECLFVIPRVCRFHIRFDGEIVIQFYAKASESQVRLYFLNLVIPILIHVKGWVPLHASSAIIDKQTILIAGDSGSGKSTVALALHQKGYEILNDDTSALFLENHEVRVFDGFSHIKVMLKSLQLFGHVPQKFTRVCRSPTKYSFPIKKKITHFSNPVNAIFFVRVTNVDKLRIEKLDGLKKIQFIRRYTLDYSLIKPLKNSKSYFDLCTAVAASVSLFIVHRPAILVDENLSDFLLKQLRSMAILQPE